MVFTKLVYYYIEISFLVAQVLEFFKTDFFFSKLRYSFRKKSKVSQNFVCERTLAYLSLFVSVRRWKYGPDKSIRLLL